MQSPSKGRASKFVKLSVLAAILRAKLALIVRVTKRGSAETTKAYNVHAE